MVCQAVLLQQPAYYMKEFRAAFCLALHCRQTSAQVPRMGAGHLLRAAQRLWVTRRSPARCPSLGAAGKAEHCHAPVSSPKYKEKRGGESTLL